jgi:hypothetical protein
MRLGTAPDYIGAGDAAQQQQDAAVRKTLWTVGLTAGLFAVAVGVGYVLLRGK